MNMHLITVAPKYLIIGAIAGAVAVEQLATNYTQTFITVAGEIAIACISGYCLIKVAQLKSHINSRMDELLMLTKKDAHAEGVIEGKRKERAEVAVVTKGVADQNKGE
jgi:hypothetical protein